VAETDVSEAETRRAAVWSKVLPFILLIWALTGAFYPAIDLCAGEKERGTLETLLSSPARRSEIVWGKLLTVIVFSMATALLNLASMGVTGAFIMQQLERMADVGISVDLGPPPLATVGWLLLAVVPIAALFSALALAIAAFARGSKEGQYYLMPLLLITLPLMILPMLPTAELELGTSVIPVTGMMLWLRALIEGEYVEAARYAMPVIGVTIGCCLLAIRWAVRQFEDETVLFRESERLGLRLWVRHMVRDRGQTPTVAEALLCGVLLLLITFFVGLRTAPPDSWLAFVKTVLVTQIALIAGPVLIMAAMLTRSPRATLLLRAPRPVCVPAALLLAVALHPLVMLLGQGIETLYPMGEDTLQALEPWMTSIREAPLVYVILLVALVPAVCEELAFRGFILSGLRHTGSKWGAIVISSVFFGLTHGLLQQSLAAVAVGVVIGYIAVQTGSLLPGMIFHFTHNSLSLLSGRVTAELVERYPLLGLLYQANDSSVLTYTYNAPLVIVSGAVAVALLLWFRRLPYARYAEEQLQETLHHQSTRATAEA
jgi:sodium transport system permease protein